MKYNGVVTVIHFKEVSIVEQKLATYFKTNIQLANKYISVLQQVVSVILILSSILIFPYATRHFQIFFPVLLNRWVDLNFVDDIIRGVRG